MKKILRNKAFAIVIIALLLMIFIVIISKENNQKNLITIESQGLASELIFSNLVDVTTQKEVKAAMLYAGISEDNIDSFFDDVNNFNTTIKEKTLVENGFTTIKSIEPEYDLISMMDMWDAENPLFIGYNCRITTYDLLKDLITVKNPNPENSDWMMFDKNALENNPKKLFSESEYQDFQTLFASVPAEETRDIQIHLKNVQENWKNKGIEFPENENLSVISVFFHDFENYLFIGHMGVLITTEDEELLFLEKLSFQAPYQAVKFSNRTELNDYLMNKYDISWNQPEARPFIMENDQLLDGYRENQNSPQK